MNEYQISIARDSQFLFRTDWNHRQGRMQSAVDVLQAAGLQVEVTARVPRMTRVTDQFKAAAK